MIDYEIKQFGSMKHFNGSKNKAKKLGESKWKLPSEMSRSRISHAKIVGFSRLYCSILETTAGVATFGLEPPIKPGGRNVPGMDKGIKQLMITVSKWKPNTVPIRTFLAAKLQIKYYVLHKCWFTKFKSNTIYLKLVIVR